MVGHRCSVSPLTDGAQRKLYSLSPDRTQVLPSVPLYPYRHQTRESDLLANQISGSLLFDLSSCERQSVDNRMTATLYNATGLCGHHISQSEPSFIPAFRAMTQSIKLNEKCENCWVDVHDVENPSWVAAAFSKKLITC